MRPANLFARSLLFYERTDMSSGAQRAKATNGRGCESEKHEATGLRVSCCFNFGEGVK